MKTLLKDTLILVLITVCAGFLLGVVYDITKEPIAKEKERAKMEACAQVFGNATSFQNREDMIQNQATLLSANGYEKQDIIEVMEALDADKQLLGYVITVNSHEGYGGDIIFSMGVQIDGTLNGISFLEISETPGLGMKAESVLGPQLQNKQVEAISFTKTGAVAESQIDAISGATITTNAITNGVNAGLLFFQQELGGEDNE